METACLRIKFTPLLHKKCCLEIVPELSCVKNLDKLTWRQETNFIEYTIPMTYKVILKKRQAIEDVNDNAIKTYHSCVDLLLTSSKSALELGSGDISRIISDTFILNKCIGNSPSRQTFVNAFTDVPEHSSLILKYPVFNKATKTNIQLEDKKTKVIKKNKTEDKQVEIKTNTRRTSEIVIIDKASLDKMNNTEDVYPVLGDTVKSNPIMLTTPEKSFTKHEFTRRLSLSPLCSIDTQETPFENKIVASKSVTCKLYESHKDLLLLGSISSPSDFSHGQDSNAISAIIDIPRQKSSKKLKFNCRIPPEIRVANYMRYIEKEIMPLNMMLNEILCKCCALGVILNKVPSIPSLTCTSGAELQEHRVETYKSVSMYGSSPETTQSEEFTKSNRVVYSIVFDG